MTERLAGGATIVEPRGPTIIAEALPGEAPTEERLAGGATTRGLLEGWPR